MKKDPRQVGSHTAPMICGTSPNGNAHTVYCMIHHPELVPPVECPHIELGHLAEPVIIARHNTKHADAGKFLPGKTYERVIDGIPCRATPDGELEDGSAILECKVRFFRDRDFYGEEGSSNVMASDYDQVQWQMHVMGEHVKRAYVAVWFGIAQDLEQFIVERDQERIDEMMAIIGNFWTFNVEAKVPPADDESEQCRKYWAHFESVSEKRREFTQEEWRDTAQWAELDAEITRLEKQKKGIENRLRASMGDHEELWVSGTKTKVTFKTNKRGARPLRVYWK